MEEDIANLKRFVEGDAKKADAEVSTQTEPTAPETPPGALTYQAPANNAATNKKFNFKSPGSLALLLIFILFLVFAIAPAYEGASQTRLQVIFNAIFRGGSFKGKNTTASLSSYTNTPDNGATTADYSFVPVYIYGNGVDVLDA